MSKLLQPSHLRHVRELLESGEELGHKQRTLLLRLVVEAIDARKLDNSLAEFHKWIRLGEPILTAVEKELAELRALTAEGGETISKIALLNILDKYRNHKPKNEVDNGVNWVLDKIALEAEKLRTV